MDSILNALQQQKQQGTTHYISEYPQLQSDIHTFLGFYGFSLQFLRLCRVDYVASS
jgi:hypothetical protein